MSAALDTFDVEPSDRQFVARLSVRASPKTGFPIRELPLLEAAQRRFPVNNDGVVWITKPLLYPVTVGAAQDVIRQQHVLKVAHRSGDRLRILPVTSEVILVIADQLLGECGSARV